MREYAVVPILFFVIWTDGKSRKKFCKLCVIVAQAEVDCENLSYCQRTLEILKFENLS